MRIFGGKKFNSAMKTLVWCTLLAFVVCLGSGTAFAQSTTEGAIAGTVFDQSGAVVPNATVTIHNNGTNAEQTVTTDSAGFYSIGPLPPTVYTVTITASGFEKFIAEQVVVSVGSVTPLSPRLTVGAPTQAITVTAEAPQINTTSPDFAQTLNQTAISNLPLQRPRWSNFALLTPGVVSNYDGFGLLSFRGTSAILNNNTIDGADNNQAFFSEERGRTRISYSSSQESIQEFQVNTSNYSAEYGRAAGGVINTITKSGTNNLHGEAFYRNRENGWASRNPFATITEQTAPGVYTPLPFKPEDQWNIWGFGVGGPIIKDKLFFFLAYDGYKRIFPGDAVASGPSAFFSTPSTALPAGDTCTAANNKSPGKISGPTGFSATSPTAGACAIAGIVVEGTSNPVSYATGLADYNAGFAGLITNLGPNARTGKQDILFPKLDWQINQKNRATFEVNRMRWASPYGVQTQVINFYSNGAAFGNDYVSDTWGVGRLDTFFTPTVSNEIRYQVGRDLEFETMPNPNAYEANELQSTTAGSTTYPSWTTYTNPLGIPTAVAISNAFTFGAPYYDTRYAYPNELRNQIADTVTWIHGNHTFKFGADFSHVKDVISDIYQQNGSFSYSSVSQYLEDLYAPAACSGKPCTTNYSNFSQGFGTLTFTVPTDDVAFFAQDDWKIRPRLSLSLGLRWEYEKLPAPFFPNSAVPQTTKLPEPKTNFGPRVGFAWDVFGDGKTSVRGGAGIYYGRITNGVLFGMLTQTGLIQSGALTGQPSYSFSSAAKGGPYLPEILTTEPSQTAPPAIQYFNPNYKEPQIDEVDFAVERNVGWNTVVSASYIGSFGHFLPQVTDDNIAIGTNAAGANPTITYYVGGGGPLKNPTYTTNFYAYRPNAKYAQMLDLFGVNSNYNGLVVQVNHRMSNHVQFNANYTWSHALDQNPSFSTNLTASSGYNMFQPNNLKDEYGDSSNNIPNRFVFNIVASSPWHVKGAWGRFADDWQIAPVFQVQSGWTYNVGTSGSAPGILGNGGGLNGSDGTFRIDIPGRNVFKDPGTQNLDLRISKTVPLTERFSLELLAEGFNVFNHFNATGVNTTGYFIDKSGSIIDTNGATQSCTSATPCLGFNSGASGFGAVNTANSNFVLSTRQLQFGLRLKF